MATFTGTKAVNEFRRFIQDTAAPNRVSTPTALSLLNQAQRLLATLQPAAFLKKETVNLVQGCVQPKPHPRSTICNVLESATGAAVTPVSKQLMDSFNIDWMNDTASSEVLHQVLVAEDTENFYIYPPQPATPSQAKVISDVTPTELNAVEDVMAEVEDRYFLAIPNLMAYIHYMEDAGVEANAVLAEKFKAEADRIIAARSA